MDSVSDDLPNVGNPGIGGGGSWSGFDTTPSIIPAGEYCELEPSELDIVKAGKGTPGIGDIPGADGPISDPGICGIGYVGMNGNAGMGGIAPRIPPTGAGAGCGMMSCGCGILLKGCGPNCGGVCPDGDKVSYTTCGIDDWGNPVCDGKDCGPNWGNPGCDGGPES